MKEHIEITCYGKKKVWMDREAAKQFYLECMAGSEGSERDRYTNIYIDLMSGKTECFDEEQEETDLSNVQDMNL